MPISSPPRRSSCGIVGLLHMAPELALALIKLASVLAKRCIGRAQHLGAVSFDDVIREGEGILALHAQDDDLSQVMGATQMI